LILARVIFGLGGECMSVSQSAIISYWFKGKTLAFALAINLSVSRLGSVIMANTVPNLYENYGFGFACLVGLFVCIFSLLCAFILISIDGYAEKLYPQGRKGIASDEKFRLSDLYNFNASFWMLTGSCVVTYMTVFPYF
jgi:MFS family permease